MTDHTTKETTAMDRNEIAKAIYHATPRNKPFEQLSAFKRERLLAEADAFLASLSAAGYVVLSEAEMNAIRDGALEEAAEAAENASMRVSYGILSQERDEPILHRTAIASLIRALGRKA